MLQVILLIAICYVIIKFKSQIREGWNSLKNSTQIKTRPSKLRDYHPMILLSEVVHYRVLPEFGISADLIRREWRAVETQLASPTERVRVADLIHVYKEKATTVDPTVVLFFEEINKNYSIGERYLINDVLLAIEYGLEK